MHHANPIMGRPKTVLNYYNPLKLSKEELRENFLIHIKSNDVKSVKLLLNLPEDKLVNINYGEGVFLEAACDLGNINLVNYFLNEKNAVLFPNNNAINAACRNGNMEIVKLLTKHHSFDSSLDYSRVVKSAIKSKNQDLVNII